MARTKKSYDKRLEMLRSERSGFIDYWREEEDSRSLNGWQITFRKHVRHQWGKYGKQWKG